MFSVLDTNLLIQANWRGRVMRNEFLDIKKKAIIVQSYFRMQRALKEYKIISDQRQVAAILIQSWVRRFVAQCKLHSTAQQSAAIMIQVKICTKYRKHCKSYVSFHQIGLFLSKAKVWGWFFQLFMGKKKRKLKILYHPH